MMDPGVALRELLDALAEGERKQAQERLGDLADWLVGGGFLPRVHKLGRLVLSKELLVVYAVERERL